METQNKTTISITQDLWKLLNSNRATSKDEIEDVIWRFIREDETNEEKQI